MKTRTMNWIKSALSFVLLVAHNARKSGTGQPTLPDYEARQKHKITTTLRSRQYDRLMKFFIASESVFFLSLLISYLYYRALNDVIAQTDYLLNAQSTGLFTLLLVASSGTLWWARQGLSRGNTQQLILGLGATILLGTGFLYGQGKEYARLFRKNMTIDTNIFGSAFFTLTGFHGLHVLVGLIVLILVLILALLGDFKTRHSDAVSSAELYWHFVDSVWIVVFFVVYILPLL